MAILETYSTNNNKTFLNVVKGAFRQKVAEGTEGAIERQIVDKEGNPTGEIRFEKVYNKLTGIITDMYFKELPFGEVLNLEFDNDVIVGLMVSREEFKDFANKLPLIDLKEEIILVPYEIDVENKNPKTKKEHPTRKKRGLTIYQLGDKIEGSAYVNYNQETREFKYKNGFPEPDKKKVEKMGSKYWKTYFPEVEYFLVEEVKKVVDGFKKIEKLPLDEKLYGDDNADNISVDDLPF